jgi:hypothetical protein
METLETLYTFLYYYGFGLFLPSIQPQSLLELTRTGFEESVTELYTIFLKQYLHFFRDFATGNLFLTLVSITDNIGSMLFKFDDCAGQGI